jgi:hypothetical protein
MPALPNPNQAPRRDGRMQSLGAILGSTDTEAPKRITLKGNYREPSLPFLDRMQWLAKVQCLVAHHSRERKSYPHKLSSVARVMAYVGDVCRPSIETIADKAGCVPNTVKACIAWLEEQGAVTWNHTARKHSNGRMVRSSNLYTLITNFNGLVATVARALRAIWRERPTLSKGNGCPGLPQTVSYQEQEEARRRLAEINRQRQQVLSEVWNARHAT